MKSNYKLQRVSTSNKRGFKRKGMDKIVSLDNYLRDIGYDTNLTLDEIVRMHIEITKIIKKTKKKLNS